MHEVSSRPINLLMVDDDSVDVSAFRRSLRKNKILNRLHVARDGLEGLEMLRGENGYEALELPYIILLDLNMPRMDGVEFLEELRQDPKLHKTVVFVLTTSDADQDKTRAYEHHIAGYIVKSRIGDDFMELLSVLQPYWRIVELPTS